MVLTGATSGIGLVTARMAAGAGVRLVLNARSEEALRELCDEIAVHGGQAIPVAGDIADETVARELANAAVRRFGGFDIWVNNAGVSIYGRMWEIPTDDHRRLFETNFWGTVHGSLAAAEHLRHRGGTLINVGSTLSDRAIPLQGMYCASKHAVKGFTDALRMEMEAAGWPVHVTLVKPSAIDTPYVSHARNYLPAHPQNPPPVYAPEVVARTILRCAVKPVREVFVGAGGKLFELSSKFAPRLTDRLMEKMLVPMQQGGKPRPRRDALYHGGGQLQERGGYEGHVAESSVYTAASLHPMAATAALLGAAGAVAAGVMLTQKD